MNSVPTKASTIPYQAALGSRRPLPRAIRPVKMDWVATRPVAEATEVYLTEGTQVPKCRARKTPARAASNQLRRLRAASCWRCRDTVSTAVKPAPKALRQNAMASAGAAVAAISGPLAETPASAISSNPASWRGGRVSDSCRTVGCTGRVCQVRRARLLVPGDPFCPVRGQAP